MIRDTDTVIYNVIFDRDPDNNHQFSKYSDALAFALASNALWIDVDAAGDHFALSATVSKIVNGKEVDIHPEYKIG